MGVPPPRTETDRAQYNQEGHSQSLCVNHQVPHTFKSASEALCVSLGSTMTESREVPALLSPSAGKSAGGIEW